MSNFINFNSVKHGTALQEWRKTVVEEVQQLMSLIWTGAGELPLDAKSQRVGSADELEDAFLKFLTSPNFRSNAITTVDILCNGKVVGCAIGVDVQDHAMLRIIGNFETNDVSILMVSELWSGIIQSNTFIGFDRDLIRTIVRESRRGSVMNGVASFYDSNYCTTLDTTSEPNVVSILMDGIERRITWNRDEIYKEHSDFIKKLSLVNLAKGFDTYCKDAYVLNEMIGRCSLERAFELSSVLSEGYKQALETLFDLTFEEKKEQAKVADEKRIAYLLNLLDLAVASTTPRSNASLILLKELLIDNSFAKLVMHCSSEQRTFLVENFHDKAK